MRISIVGVVNFNSPYATRGEVTKGAKMQPLVPSLNRALYPVYDDFDALKENKQPVSYFFSGSNIVRSNALHLRDGNNVPAIKVKDAKHDLKGSSDIILSYGEDYYLINESILRWIGDDEFTLFPTEEEVFVLKLIKIEDTFFSEKLVALTQKPLHYVSGVGGALSYDWVDVNAGMKRAIVRSKLLYKMRRAS